MDQVEVDFANKYVGFGTTGTQEELMLGPSPEFCIIVLFNEILDPNEAILMTGGRRYGNHSGYGRASRFTGPFPPSRDWNQRKIVFQKMLGGCIFHKYRHFRPPGPIWRMCRLEG